MAETVLSKLHIFENPHIRYYENPSLWKPSCSMLTDRHEANISFSHFAKASKNVGLHSSRSFVIDPACCHSVEYTFILPHV